MIVDGHGEQLPLLSDLERIPPRPDSRFGGQPGLYADSALADVCGTLSNPDAKEDKYGEPPPFLSAASPDLDAHLQQVGGFDARTQLNQPPAADWPLTGIITRIGLGAGGKVDLAPFPGTYILDYAKLAPGPDGIPRHPWALKIKEQLPKGSRLLLSFFDYDKSRAPQSLWVMTDFWHQSVLAQFDGIIPHNFWSVSDVPIPQLLAGERMDQIFLTEGHERNQMAEASHQTDQDQGNTIIPVIAWGHQESSLRRQVELLVSKPTINTICIDAHGPGLDRTLWTWRWLIALEKYASPHRHIRWIITGITSGWAIRELNRIFPDKNYHLILSLSAYVHAKGASADLRLQEEHLRRAVNRLELLRTGEDVSPAKTRPIKWPTYADCVPRQLG